MGAALRSQHNNVSLFTRLNVRSQRHKLCACLQEDSNVQLQEVRVLLIEFARDNKKTSASTQTERFVRMKEDSSVLIFLLQPVRRSLTKSVSRSQYHRNWSRSPKFAVEVEQVDQF